MLIGIEKGIIDSTKHNKAGRIEECSEVFVCNFNGCGNSGAGWGEVKI